LGTPGVEHTPLQLRELNLLNVEISKMELLINLLINTQVPSLILLVLYFRLVLQTFKSRLFGLTQDYSADGELLCFEAFLEIIDFCIDLDAFL
jgi:hypothetical protein